MQISARAVDREFNYNFGSNLGPWALGRGSNRRGAPVGLIWAEFQLKRSHGDPFLDQNPGIARPVFLGTDQLLLGTDQFLLGTDQLLLGTDPSLLGTDQSVPGTDH